MTLEEIRAKALADLTEEEKTFIAEHKAELTEDELAKFELKEADPAPEEPAPEAAAPVEGGAPVQASAITGITETELAQLRADAQSGREAKAELEKNKATALVKSHIAAGRIVADQEEATVTMLLASKGEQRTQLEAFIGGLTANPIMASEAGHGGEGPVDPEISKEETEYAGDFGNTPEEIAEYKKTQAKA